VIKRMPGKSTGCGVQVNPGRIAVTQCMNFVIQLRRKWRQAIPAALFSVIGATAKA